MADLTEHHVGIKFCL